MTFDGIHCVNLQLIVSCVISNANLVFHMFFQDHESKVPKALLEKDVFPSQATSKRQSSKQLISILVLIATFYPVI